jgi:hypothetical protein
MPRIEIDKLSENELIDLNRRIVERLRFLDQMKAHSRMLEFRIGERVSFKPDGEETKTGILTRYNKKTVTIITDSGEQWNVAPTFLRRIDESKGLKKPDLKIIPKPEK